jgi:hypothetical protein
LTLANRKIPTMRAQLRVAVALAVGLRTLVSSAQANLARQAAHAAPCGVVARIPFGIAG